MTNAHLQAAALLSVFGAGVLLGWAFFYTLRLTVQQLPSSARPSLLLAASSLTRLALTGAALTALAGDSLSRWAVALGGLLAARALCLRRYAGARR